jgi:putative oxidoreductase
LIKTNIHSSVILIRFIVGFVFLSEGIQKFLYPDTLGVGRFVKIGIPVPAFFAPFDGIFEIVCGAFLIFGLLTRIAAVPMIINITVAIISTKIPMLINKGFWSMAHEARTDFSMLFGLVFLLIVGAGKISLDEFLMKRKDKEIYKDINKNSSE